MPVYIRYIIQDIMSAFLVIACVMIGIVLMVQMSKLLYLIDRGVQLYHFFYLSTLIIPYLLFAILPFVTMISVIYIYNKLVEEKQLIILQICGNSNIKLIQPVLYFAIIVSILSYYLAMELMPRSYKTLKSEIHLIKDNYISSIVHVKTFNQISKSIIVYVNKKLSNSKLEGIVLFDNRDADHMVVLFAESGILQIKDSVPKFLLTKGVRQSYDKNGNMTKLSFDVLTIELVESQPIQTENSGDINALYVSELLFPNDALPIPKQLKFIAEGHQRIIWPLYNLVLPFIALSVFLYSPYTKKHLKHFMITGIAVTCFTYGHFTFTNIASKNLNFIYACYINVIISIICSILLCLRRA